MYRKKIKGNKEIRYKEIEDFSLYPYIPIPLYLLLTLIILAACNGELSKKEKQQVNSALNDSLLATTESWDVDMEIISDGVKKVHLIGSYAATFNTERTSETRIKGPVFIEVFDSTGAMKTTVKANRAIYYSKKSAFEFFGNVDVKSATGRALQSEYLKWNQGENKIETQKFVIITTKDDSLAGTGFYGTADLSEYTILNPSGEVVLN